MSLAEQPTRLISREEAEGLGLRSFFTGTPCQNGHVAMRAISNGGCKQCSREYTQKYRAANPDKVEEGKIRCRAWHIANKDRANFRHRAFRINSKEEYRLQRIAWRSKPDARAIEMLCAIRHTCKKRNLPMDVDKAWILERLYRGTCELTGLHFRLNPLPKGRQNPYTASIDRIKPELGYVKGNIRMILWALNAGFNTYGEDIYAEIALVYLKQRGLT